MKKLDLSYRLSIYNDSTMILLPKTKVDNLMVMMCWYRKTFKLDEEDLNKNVRITLMGLYGFSGLCRPAVGHYPNGYN